MTKAVKNKTFNWGDYFYQHRLACQVSWRDLKATPFASLLTIAAIGVCLAFPLSLYLFTKNIENLSQGWRFTSTMSIYVAPQTPLIQINTLIDKIKQYPDIAKVTYLTSDQALQEFEQAMDDKSILTLLPENPLPAVIGVQFSAHPQSLILLQIKNDLSQFSYIQSISCDDEWLAKLQGFLAFGQKLTLGLYLVITLGVTLMVANTIRLALMHHRDEIKILNLLGATAYFIRRPFLYRAILYAGIGGLLAILIVYGLRQFLHSCVQHLLSLYQNTFVLEKFKISELFLFLMTCIAVGMLGASLAFQSTKRINDGD